MLTRKLQKRKLRNKAKCENAPKKRLQLHQLVHIDWVDRERAVVHRRVLADEQFPRLLCLFFATCILLPICGNHLSAVVDRLARRGVLLLHGGQHDAVLVADAVFNNDEERNEVHASWGFEQGGSGLERKGLQRRRLWRRISTSSQLSRLQNSPLCLPTLLISSSA